MIRQGCSKLAPVLFSAAVLALSGCETLDSQSTCGPHGCKIGGKLPTVHAGVGLNFVIVPVPIPLPIPRLYAGCNRPALGHPVAVAGTVEETVITEPLPTIVEPVPAPPEKTPPVTKRTRPVPRNLLLPKTAAAPSASIKK